MKKKISLFLTGVILISSAINAFGAEGMFIDNKPYVPVRTTFEELGFDVDYINATAMAIITDKDYRIEIPKNKNYFMVNGKGLKPDYPQKIVKEKMYIPFSAVGMTIAAATSYDSDKNRAHFSYNEKDSYTNCSNYILPTKQLLQGRWISKNKEATFIVSFSGDKFAYSAEDNKTKKIETAVGTYAISGDAIGLTIEGWVDGKDLSYMTPGYDEVTVYDTKFSRDGKILYFAFNKGNFFQYTKLK